MSKQKSLTISLRLLITIVAVLGSASACTLSHLNPNVYADGPVDIKIIEKGDDGSGNIIDEWQDITNAMPGTTYHAIPRVINYGTVDINVRVCLSRSGQTSTGDPITVTNEHITINLEPNWTKETDAECYNYDYPLAPGSLTDPLFSSVTINNISNEHQGSTFNLHLYAEAIGDIPTTPNSPDTGFFSQVTTNAIIISSVTIIGIIIAILILRQKSSK